MARVTKAELLEQNANLKRQLNAMRIQRDNAMNELQPLKRALHLAHTTRTNIERELRHARSRIAASSRSS